MAPPCSRARPPTSTIASPRSASKSAVSAALSDRTSQRLTDRLRLDSHPPQARRTGSHCGAANKDVFLVGRPGASLKSGPVEPIRIGRAGTAIFRGCAQLRIVHGCCPLKAGAVFPPLGRRAGRVPPSGKDHLMAKKPAPPAKTPAASRALVVDLEARTKA
jgi:hypothetical protein